MLKNNQKKAKIITNGNNSIKSAVREELTLVLAHDRGLRKRLRYLICAHQEKLVPSGLMINKRS